MSLRARASAVLRNPNVVLGLVALVAAVLRARVLIGRSGPWAFPVDYDEGVYFSASALLTRGHFPWRDFVFVHPPGVLLGWAPFAAFGGVTAFEVCRFSAAALGGLNAFLLGRMILPRAGLFGAVTAASLYAVYPEAMGTERGPFIEPWLNLTCIVAATAALRQRWVAAGALWALALFVKLWAVLWLPAVLLLWLEHRDKRAVASFAGTVLVLFAPFVLFAPEAFWQQVVALQLVRPPDATQGTLQRLTEIFHSGHWGAMAFGMLAIVVLARRGEARRTTAFFAIAMAAVVGAFLAASAYWGQYNAHLAVPQCALAGLGVTALGSWRLRWLVLAAALLPSLRLGAPGRTQELITLRQELRGTPGCIFAFEPAWGLVAGALPAAGDGAPLVVDTYGAMLVASLPGGRFPEAGAAMRSEPAQQYLRKRLEACPTIVMGWRGDWQLSDETKAWLRATHTRTSSAAIDVWVRAP